MARPRISRVVDIDSVGKEQQAIYNRKQYIYREAKRQGIIKPKQDFFSLNDDEQEAIRDSKWEDLQNLVSKELNN